MNTANLSKAIRNQDTNDVIRHLKVSDSSLGGHSSNFAIQDGKLELISKGLGMPKFRKCNAKNEANVAEKIVKYCYSV